MNALGAQCIPDPTTAGDFCQRFESEVQIFLLMETINEARLRVWKQQASPLQQQEGDFFNEAIIDADGTIAPAYGECKSGMNLTNDG
jgi:hypothetical protein